MLKVHVRGLKTSGKEFKRSIDEAAYSLAFSDVRKIDLIPISACKDLRSFKLFSSYGLSSLDLSPLTECSIKKIHVEKTQISEIDLTPLASMTGLEKFYLNNNRIESIDLTPIAKCGNLQGIWLNDCIISSLDLSPLAGLENLRILCLQGNLLEKIDLSPLASCGKLEILKLSVNKLSSVDLSPLASCKQLTHIHLDFNKLQSLDLTPLSDNKELRYVLLNDNLLSDGSVDFKPLENSNNFLKTSLENTAQVIASQKIQELKPTIVETLKEKIG